VNENGDDSSEYNSDSEEANTDADANDESDLQEHGEEQVELPARDQST
jgi:hypothetical protein